MPVTQQTYRALVLEDPEGQWELHHGRLREKPAMSVTHNRVMARLVHQLSAQLDVDRFEVRTNTGRLRYSDETYYIPDIHVVPVGIIATIEPRQESLEVLGASMPFVAEVWSPSTGEYDVDRKIPEYQRRGDLEIWRIHPYDRTVSIWRRTVDGTYDATEATSGVIELAVLPGVKVDIDRLFAFG